MERVLMMDCGDSIRRADNGCFGKYVAPKTASFSVVAADAGKIFSNSGAAAAIVATLPAAKHGLRFMFIRPTVAYGFTITAVTPAKINGGIAAGSIYVAPGGSVELFSDGTDWYTSTFAGTAQAAVTLTNAQIKALRATPVEIVPAFGANKIIEFISGSLILIAGVNVLTESGCNFGLKYTDGSGVQVNETVEATGFIDQAVNTMTSIRKKLDAIVASSAAANKALVLHNVGGAEIAGNAGVDATLICNLSYRVISAV